MHQAHSPSAPTVAPDFSWLLCKHFRRHPPPTKPNFAISRLHRFSLVTIPARVSVVTDLSTVLMCRPELILPSCLNSRVGNGQHRPAFAKFFSPYENTDVILPEICHSLWSSLKPGENPIVSPITSPLDSPSSLVFFASHLTKYFARCFARCFVCFWSPPSEPIHFEEF